MVDFTQTDMNRFQYQDWISHFENNDTKRLKIDYSGENPLSEKMKRLVLPSIRAF